MDCLRRGSIADPKTGVNFLSSLRLETPIDLWYDSGMTEKVRSKESVGHVADAYNESRRQELNDRLKRWGIMAAGGIAATWAGWGISLVGGPVAWAIGSIMWALGSAFATVGVVAGVGNILSRIRKKNR